MNFCRVTVSLKRYVLGWKHTPQLYVQGKKAHVPYIYVVCKDPCLFEKHFVL